MLVTNIRKDRGGDHRERVGLAVPVAVTCHLDPSHAFPAIVPSLPG